jgi:glycerophosphoryl diester phosphodiesterase
VSRTRIAAHRGGAALWPENSLLAFRRAIALGVSLVELDVHLSRDDGIVVIHDRTLDRTTNGVGPVGDRTTDELHALRLRDHAGALSDEHVPTLDDVLTLVSRSSGALLLEIKGPGPSVVYERVDGRLTPIPGPRYERLEERVLERLAASGMTERTTVMAFNPEVIRQVRALAPAARTTLLVDAKRLAVARASVDDALAFATELGVTDVGLEHTLIDAAVVAATHRCGLALGAWTVNDGASIRRYADLGVDIVTSDRPDVALETLGAAGRTA